MADAVRGKFTGYERDAETGLDYARARYFASAQGRFSGADPLLSSGRPEAPQTWNRYSYALNNPLKYADPSGMEAEEPDQGQVQNIPARETQQPPPQQPTRQTAPGINAPEVSNGVVSAEQIDVDLAFIFGGTGSIARGASAARGIPHMTTPEGMLHTFHLYGDTSGEKITTVFLPGGFINATYEGGPNNQVSAENEETGEILVLAHVAGISSQRDLDKNLNSGVVNGAGSRLVGRIGGPGGDSPGYNHVHGTIYRDARGREDIRSQKGSDGWKPVKDFSGYGNMGGVVPQVLRE